MDYQIVNIKPEQESLKAVMELHFKILPSRAYETDEKKLKLSGEVAESLPGRQGIVLAAMKAQQCIGYKIAYVTGNRREKLYIWLGGVHPMYRRQGIARALMQRMVEYANSLGVECMESHVFGTNQAMMILNLQSGFEVQGCLHGAGTNTVRVTMRKAIP